MNYLNDRELWELVNMASMELNRLGFNEGRQSALTEYLIYYIKGITQEIDARLEREYEGGEVVQFQGAVGL